MMAVSTCESVCKYRGIISSDVLSNLKEILPACFEHIVCKCEGTVETYKAVVRSTVCSRDEADVWKQAFNESTMTTLHVRRTKSVLATKVLFKVDYKCQHNTEPVSVTADKRRGSKNTDCPATVHMTVYKSKKDRKCCWSSDVHLSDFPTLIKIRFCHNHPVDAAAALRNRDVSESTRLKIEKLLESYRPSTALEMFKFDLQLENPHTYVYMCGDRAQCPDLSYVYRLHYKLGKKLYGDSGSKAQVSQLKEYVEAKNAYFEKAESTTKRDAKDITVYADETASCSDPQPLFSADDATPTAAAAGDSCAAHHPIYLSMDITADEQLVVAVCTPLMHRVHKLVKHSGEMVFIDATGNIDRNNCRIFLLLTHSCVGGLPLGVLITSSESTTTIRAGLELLKKMVGDAGFYGRGVQGPLVFMTDDCRAERTALQESFPNAKLVLCIFHVLQAFWRFVWDSKTGVPIGWRPQIFHMVKDLVYASGEKELHTKLESACAHDLIACHPKILKYIKNLYDRRTLWALCLREDLLIRGNHTNNFCETAMRVLKDQVLNRTKAFNVQQLVDFVSTRLEMYYERRCIDVANTNLQKHQQSRYLLQDRVDAKYINQISPTDFEVQSTDDPSNHYRVDMSVGLCTCKVGCTGGPCKHQASIVQQFGLQSWNFIPENNPEMRQLFCQIGSGQLHDIKWFESLKKRPSLSTETPVNSIHVDETSPEGSAASTGIDMPDYSNVSKISTSTSVDQIVNETPSDPISPSTSKEKSFDCTSQIRTMHDFVDMVAQKAEINGDIFKPAMDAFLKKASRMRTDTHLLSALHTFGDSSGVSMPVRMSKLVSSKHISVQPTAVARRQLRTLPGCSIQGVGRTPKNSSQSQGIKHKITVVCGGSLPKRKKAAHSLSLCVQENISHLVKNTTNHYISAMCKCNLVMPIN